MLPHEYRLADAIAGRAAKKDGTLRLDDWVLCRLYNKKNEWEKMQQKQQEEEEAVKADASQCISWGEMRTPESDMDNDPLPELDSLPALELMGTRDAMPPKEEVRELDNDGWLMGISLDDMQGPGSLLPWEWDDSYASSFLSPMASVKMEQDVSPFFF